MVNDDEDATDMTNVVGDDNANIFGDDTANVVGVV